MTEELHEFKNCSRSKRKADREELARRKENDRGSRLHGASFKRTLPPGVGASSSFAAAGASIHGRRASKLIDSTEMIITQTPTSAAQVGKIG